MNNLYEGTNINIIEELYYGNINPSQKCFDRDSNYARCASNVLDNSEKLNTYFENHSNMKDEQKWFSQLLEAQSDILCFCDKNRFIEGFQLGAKFMLDTFILPQQSVIRDID
uniref:Uncharacterized protein n=1 Tax=uncultured Bacillota bacterium TaxID=344338 RepID=A0A650F4S2_9FIRM|nr:hypothetical protein Firmicute1046_2010 [uncultured Firmicutes bacterium]